MKWLIIYNSYTKLRFELIKIILFLYEFFINDESNRLIILIMFILLEYYSELFYAKQKTINKVIISIIINMNEIFYLLINRVYSLETTKKYFSKTIAYFVESSEIIMIFLELFYKARSSFVVFGYFKKMNVFLNNRYYHDKSFILRIILFFYFNFNTFIIIFNNYY